MLGKRLEKAEATITVLEGFKKNVEDRLNSLEKKIPEGSHTMNEKNSAVDEMEEREKRKSNIVFYGLTESEKENSKDRVEDDKAEVISTLKTAGIQLTPSSLLQIFRAGKKSEKARPIIVKMSCKDEKDKIIEKGREIKTKTGIRVSPDLTPMQRKHLSSLYEEAEEKNKIEMGNYEWRVVGPRDLPRLAKRQKGV